MANLFQTLAGAAGLAGISIGFVLLIFREIIKKNIFPKLSAEHAYRILRLVILLTFGVGFFGIAGWAIDRGHFLGFSNQSESATVQAPQESAQNQHVRLWFPLTPKLKAKSESGRISLSPILSMFQSRRLSHRLASTISPSNSFF
jgi:hypothetical protein